MDIKDSKNKKDIVIIGAGFAGLYAYRSLYQHCKEGDINVTIINSTNYFLFTPLLHETATGGLAHHQVVESIRQSIYKTKTSLVVADVTDIDLDNKRIHVQARDCHGKECDINYDILIMATGATTNFFGTKGAEENSFVLKNLNDAIKLRSRFIDTFERASQMQDSEMRKDELSFVIVGGGPTGVELAAETAELFWNTFVKFYQHIIKPEEINLTLINSGPVLLAPFPKKLQNNALKTLQKDGIKVLLNSHVNEVNEDDIILSDGTVIKSKTVIWTAGVKANLPQITGNIQKDKSGRIITNEYFEVAGYSDVYAVGDVASVPDGNGGIAPMLAQVSVPQGELLGKNIGLKLKGHKMQAFKYKQIGQLASLGHWRAVASIYGLQFSGPLAWFIWRTVYLFKFFSGSKKFKIAMDWALNLFFPRDITKS
jgi:NADH dehydrogenase